MQDALQIVVCKTCGTKNRVRIENFYQSICGVCKSALFNQNYYEILEVNKNASPLEIKKSFRRLALIWHPDKNHENKEFMSKKFERLYEAYSILMDESKRHEYDLSLLSNKEQYHHDEVNFEEAYNAFINEMYEMAMELAFKNNNWKKIKPNLINRGCPEGIASAIAKECENYRIQVVRSYAKKPFIKSLLWFLSGIIITLITYLNTSPGGTYIVAGGPILFGAINMVKALKYLISGSIPIK